MATIYSFVGCMKSTLFQVGIYEGFLLNNLILQSKYQATFIQSNIDWKYDLLLAVSIELDI